MYFFFVLNHHYDLVAHNVEAVYNLNNVLEWYVGIGIRYIRNHKDVLLNIATVFVRLYYPLHLQFGASTPAFFVANSDAEPQTDASPMSPMYLSLIPYLINIYSIVIQYYVYTN